MTCWPCFFHEDVRHLTRTCFALKHTELCRGWLVANNEELIARQRIATQKSLCLKSTLRIVGPQPLPGTTNVCFVHNQVHQKLTESACKKEPSKIARKTKRRRARLLLMCPTP